jgi:hypothetical protein
VKITLAAGILVGGVWGRWDNSAESLQYDPKTMKAPLVLAK